jgi:hypothetical protein
LRSYQNFTRRPQFGCALIAWCDRCRRRAAKNKEQCIDQVRYRSRRIFVAGRFLRIRLAGRRVHGQFKSRRLSLGGDASAAQAAPRAQTFQARAAIRSRPPLSQRAAWLASLQRAARQLAHARLHPGRTDLVLSLIHKPF